MLREESVEYIVELQSKSVPIMKKAAAKIGKQQLQGFGVHLLNALKFLLSKPKSWQAQSEIIRALGITDCIETSEYLKELMLWNFQATILYRDLGFAICLLEDIQNNRIDFLKSTLSSGNELLISGACSALLLKEAIPSDSDIEIILESISSIDGNEGQVMTPRCYIAALAYLWPPYKTEKFLASCLQSKWDGLVEIAKSSVIAKKTKYVLV
jgi:hypothetical protein